MLTEKDYGVQELKELMRCSDKQGIDRKLKSYDIEFESSGRGPKRVYTIKHIPNPFKVYCVLKLGIPAQADFTKILHLYYYFFNSEDFQSAPLIKQEEMMVEDGTPISRKTITKWLNYLEHINYISFDHQNCWYYVIKKGLNSEYILTEIDRETYNKGWRIYFSTKDKEGCGPAYSLMYNQIGGHPYKKPSVEGNAITLSDLNELIDIINTTYLKLYD